MEETFTAIWSDWSWSTVAIMAASLLAVRYFPSLAKYLPAIGNALPAVKREPVDPRVQFSAALLTVADHTAALKCPKLRKQCDDACTTLAEAVIRKPDYEPEADETV